METAVVKRRPGRPPKRRYGLGPPAPPGATAMEIINMAAPEATSYLRAVVVGEERKPDWTRINTAQFIVKEHLARLQNEGLIDEAGNRIVSYKVLVLMAQQFVTKEDDHSDRPLELDPSQGEGLDSKKALLESFP